VTGLVRELWLKSCTNWDAYFAKRLCPCYSVVVSWIDGCTLCVCTGFSLCSAYCFN